MKNVLALLSGIVLILTATVAHAAADRSQLVQARLHSTLSSVLSKNDYVVIVNKIEALDDSLQSLPSSNMVKTLPGLNLGIDQLGRIVRQDEGGAGYYGGVAVQIVIDEAVNPRTYKLIEDLIPEIMGGLREDDEFRVTRGKLRQPLPVTASNAPMITINNAQSEPSQASQMQDHLKLLALALVGLGVILWMLSRSKGRSDKKSRDDQAAMKAAANNEKQRVEEPADYSILDAKAVSLFLLRELKERNYANYMIWKKASTPAFKRDVFRNYPAWIVSYLQNNPNLNVEPEATTPGLENETNRRSEEEINLFEQMTLFEQVIRESKNQNIFFLKYFPAEALRFVPKEELSQLSPRTKKTIWLLRQDLGGMTTLSSEELRNLTGKVSEEEIEHAYNEFCNFNLRDFITDQNVLDMNALFKSQILALREFSAISTKLSEAQGVLSQEEYETLRRNVAHVELPFLMTPTQQKAWVKNIEPEDYYWWTSLVKKQPSWRLEDYLRPMRLEMFRQSAEAQNYRNWTEEQKKKSSERVLLSMVRVLHQDMSYEIDFN